MLTARTTAVVRPIAHQAGTVIIASTGNELHHRLSASNGRRRCIPGNNCRASGDMDISNGRAHHTYSARTTAEARAGLVRRGHVLGDETRVTFGGYEAILRDARSGVYVGASDSRKDGQAGGY